MKNINNCPLCNNERNKLFSVVKDVEYLSGKEDYKYYNCSSCEAIYLDNPPIDKLNKIYPDNYYSFNENKKNNFLRKLLEVIKYNFDKLLFKKYLNRLDFKFIECLDIGGGSGWLSSIVKKLDNRVMSTTIIDLEKSSKNIAETNGHKYICSNVDDIQIKNKFHFVLMLNLIEHVINPKKTLLRVNESMKKGGILIIKTPNTNTLSKNLFKNFYWGGLHAPRHWILFNKDNFLELAKACNFEVEDFSYTQGAPQWTASVIGSINKIFNINPHKTMNQNFFNPLLNILFALFDYLTIWILKPAQMFVVLRKRD